MKASVIICTYNRAESLRTALQLLEWQTYDNFEVIVVNGPSTDNTNDVLKEYEGKIKVLHNSQKNYIISRNMGANAAAGEILCYIDDDSEPDTPWLANVIHEFEDERVGAVTGPVYDDIASVNVYPAWVCDDKTNLECVSQMLPHYSSPNSSLFPHTHGCNMSIRRVAMAQVGGFLEDFVFYWEESDVCRRVIGNGYSIVSATSCALVHKTVSGLNDKKMRHKDKGLLRSYHFLKNRIYLLFAWRQLDDPLEDLKLKAENMGLKLLNDGKRRFKEGVISYEEWIHYKEGIAPALKWGIEHGITADLKPASISLIDSTNFLLFPRRRKANALVVCLCLWSLEITGGGNSHDYLLLANRLAQKGHEVHVLCATQAVAMHSFVDHVHKHYVAINEFANIDNAQLTNMMLNNCAALYNFIVQMTQSRTVDICMGYIFNSTPLFVAMDARLSSILTLCTTFTTWCKSHPHWKPSDSFFVEKLEALAVNNHEHLHAISAFIVQGVKSDYPDSFQDSVEVFYVPIGTSFDQAVVRHSPKMMIRILFLSRLEARKSPDVLLAAFAKIMKKHDNIELVLAGDDTLLALTGRTYRQDFEAQYLGSDIGSKVHFTGFISEEEKWQHYQACDIFCMPSLSESFGIPFIEAMSCGKPVIGCRAGGMPEVITEGETGLLAEPGDVKTLAACLERLICDDALRARMGKAARLRYEQNYTAELYAERMEKEFYRIAGKTAGI